MKELELDFSCFSERTPGQCWDWPDTAMYVFVLIITFGWGLPEFRKELAREFHWSVWGAFWIISIVYVVFFIPMFLTFPLSGPCLAFYIRWSQKKEARKIVIDALKSK